MGRTENGHSASEMLPEEISPHLPSRLSKFLVGSSEASPQSSFISAFTFLRKKIFGTPELTVGLGVAQAPEKVRINDSSIPSPSLTNQASQETKPDKQPLSASAPTVTAAELIKQEIKERASHPETRKALISEEIAKDSNKIIIEALQFGFKKDQLLSIILIENNFEIGSRNTKEKSRDHPENREPVPGENIEKDKEPIKNNQQKIAEMKKHSQSESCKKPQPTKISRRR